MKKIEIETEGLGQVETFLEMERRDCSNTAMCFFIHLSYDTHGLTSLCLTPLVVRAGKPVFLQHSMLFLRCSMSLKCSSALCAFTFPQINDH